MSFNVYKILPDYEHYCSFSLPMKNLYMALGGKVPLKQLMHFYKHNLLLGDNWNDIKASFVSIEEVTSGNEIPDVTTWSRGALVFSEKALAVFDWLGDLGELLPVTTENGRYWIFNCTTIAQADEANSQRLVDYGQVMDVDKLAFLPGSVGGKDIFKTDYDGFRNIFCSDRFKSELESAGLKGLLFSENLVGAFI